ncbi:MAG: hypothetical protein J6W41_03610, partial [Alphaproteobacteria bacterium]|nr:hypothetical protein [Alphaproteobacteria bacterium]
MKNYKLWCVHNLLWRFRFTTSPCTITPSGFAIHPFFHKEGDGAFAPKRGTRANFRQGVKTPS